MLIAPYKKHLLLVSQIGNINTFLSSIPYNHQSKTPVIGSMCIVDVSVRIYDNTAFNMYVLTFCLWWYTDII